MAVEARRLTLFPPQLLGNREVANAAEVGGNAFNNSFGCAAVPPLSGTTTETLLPMYGSGMTDSFPANPALQSDSGLTYSIPLSRKRPRDSSINPLLLSHRDSSLNQGHRSTFTFLGEDISAQIQLQQLELDRFVARHIEKVRTEIEKRQKTNSRRIMAAVEEGILKRLRAKEEEIAKIGRLNWALEERVKSLCVENQIWRELAQTNEATANALRSNLEKVLAQVRDDHRAGCVVEAAALADDAQSCCGSNENDLRTAAECGGGRRGGGDDCTTTGGNSRCCRSCRKEESAVLLLPCRHLCVCTACASSLNFCPICKSAKTASVHINLCD